MAVASVLVVAYGGAWAAIGHPPFLASSVSRRFPPPSGTPVPSPPDDGSSTGDERLALEFGFAPDPLQPNSGVAWNFTVTNVSDQTVTLRFSSGRNADVVLLQGGTEKYRWSNGRFFTQAIRTDELAPGETWRFALEDTLSVGRGTYELVASLASNPAPNSAVLNVKVGA